MKVLFIHAILLHWCWISVFNGLYYESFLNYCIFILDEKNDLSLFSVCKHYWICYIRTLIAMLYFYHNEQICLLWLCSKDSYIPPLDRFCIEKQDFFFPHKGSGNFKIFFRSTLPNYFSCGPSTWVDLLYHTLGHSSKNNDYVGNCHSETLFFHLSTMGVKPQPPASICFSLSFQNSFMSCCRLMNENKNWWKNYCMINEELYITDLVSYFDFSSNISHDSALTTFWDGPFYC